MSTLKYLSCIVLLTFQPISAQNFWQKISGSLGDVEVTDLCLTNSGNLLAYIYWDGLYYTTNNGEQWVRTNYQGYEPYALETINDSILIAGRNDLLSISNDTGKTWQVTVDYDVWSLYYDSLTQSLYMGTSRGSVNGICGIYNSSDVGDNWELLYAFPLNATVQGVGPLYISKINQVILASVTYLYPPPYGDSQYSFFQSTDYGVTWETIFPAQDDRYVSYIIEDESHNLLALRGNYLLISSDEGNSWITRNIPNSDCLGADHSGRIFRAYGSNIWYSNDKGISWIVLDNSGLQGNITDIVINSNNRIYLATEEGIFIGEADSIVVSVEENKPPKTFYLSQNYPNPFNPSTKIKFEIPDQVRNDNRLVTLKVYDVLGNEIATLVNEEKPAGEYEVEFNTSSIKHLPSSGIYFYQLKAGNYVETKKMVLLK
jgi:photosystem II stability/assembly factor-like uncharacterized protein